MFFVMYGAVIIMNLLVALMTNVLDMNKAHMMIIAQRVEELSDKLELPLLGLFNSCKESNTFHYITSFFSSTKTTTDSELISKKDNSNLEEPAENHPPPAVSVRKYSFQLFLFFKLGFFFQMEFDEKRPEETNEFFGTIAAVGLKRRPLAIRKVKGNKEHVAILKEKLDVSGFSLRIRKSVMASAKEAINRRNELQKAIASENAQIIEKMDLMKQKYFQMKNHMEARLSDERRQIS